MPLRATGDYAEQAIFDHERACLPLQHRDPFDRMLVAQARQEG